MWELLTPAEVESLHDDVIGRQELQGLAKDKSLEGALGRVEFRIKYGNVHDVYDLAAVYAVALAQGHVFNDANKRTAYFVMHTCLAINGVTVTFDDTEVGEKIIEIVNGTIDEEQLAAWLREQHQKSRQGKN